MKNIEKFSYKLKCLKQGGVFTDAVIQSFKVGAIDKWQKKLKTRLIEQNITRIRALKKLQCLKQGGVFTDAVIQSFKVGAIDKWQKKLKTRLIEQNITRIRALKKLHTPENMDAIDEVIWKSISDMKYDLMKDTLTKESLYLLELEML